MSNSNPNAISAKLRKLPADFLRALVNATAILMIVAAVLAIVAITRVNNFVGNMAATMTEAVLSKIDLPSRGVLANLRELTEQVRALRRTLQEFRERDHPVLESEIARLREGLNILSASVDRLTKARTMLTDEAIARLGQSLSSSVTKMRNCTSDVGQIQRGSHPTMLRAL